MEETTTCERTSWGCFSYRVGIFNDVPCSFDMDFREIYKQRLEETTPLHAPFVRPLGEYSPPILRLSDGEGILGNSGDADRISDLLSDYDRAMGGWKDHEAAGKE
ncbi:hypothetical protein QJS10_CPB11g00788 [Acorus calamus]|uniref:Uncharacterized protein n=1 Tax=Acorus calamus TaxID=4465 RepID=A0AAV9DXU2_ACOCL|nr:hypothetical protein QJS10_CPB11g00788 [Acorus calamus]